MSLGFVYSNAYATYPGEIAFGISWGTNGDGFSNRAVEARFFVGN